MTRKGSRKKEEQEHESGGEEKRRTETRSREDDVKKNGGGNLIPVPNYMDRQLDSYIFHPNFHCVAPATVVVDQGRQATTSERERERERREMDCLQQRVIRSHELGNNNKRQKIAAEEE